jgi:hypothetical protein
VVAAVARRVDAALHDLWMAGDDLAAISPVVVHEAEQAATRQYLLTGTMERILEELVPDPDSPRPRLLSFTELHFHLPSLNL